ncbi:hypothetical protein QNO08_06220 [Arthrobacter sp. zg-Y820]|uniref:hypothetical protein n=1 Tax=unclassified Arthrobacter TaxID=235627 RepID=UPI001E38249E|nr:MULTISPECIES: hypothetical protein [unclassified Arthrobacter]MCC9197884.1 hypothetical protein [Arthrobacter sp. zg-Y820]MDK1280751.1 hypothetical protein [Arthrobacter sp. zg.Y820]WIB10622.1 hypothetical protein QNO08_06220 [Arthrobacter sp. zg-Y820]
MKEREPERNESTDNAVWLDLVARLENMPADETHGGRDAPGGHGSSEGSRIKPGATASGPDAADSPSPAGADEGAHPETPSGTGGAETAAKPGSGEGTPARGPVPRSPAERTRAIFENQPFRAQPPRGPRDYDEPEELESEGEFVPPEPPPFSTGEPLVVLAWIGALGGPLLLLLFAMFWRGAPLAVILGLVALFGVAVGYLLFRLPQHRDDDGAAV